MCTCFCQCVLPPLINVCLHVCTTSQRHPSGFYRPTVFIPVYPSGSLALCKSVSWNIFPGLESPESCMAGQTSEHFPGSIGSKSPSSVTANPHAHDVCRNDCGKRVVILFRGCFPEIVPRIMFRGTAVSSITSTIRPQLKPQLPQFCDSGLGNRGIEDMGIEELRNGGWGYRGIEESKLGRIET